MAKRARKYKLVRRQKARRIRFLFFAALLLVVGASAFLLWQSDVTVSPKQGANAMPVKVLTPVTRQSAPAVVSQPAPLPAIEAKAAEPQPPAPVPETNSVPVPIPVPAPPPVAAPQPQPNAVPQLDVYPRPVQGVLEAQIALARQGISSGPVDGLIGTQTRAALAAFQQVQGLPATGELDPPTKEVLLLSAPPLTNYIVSSTDLARLQPLSPTWLGKSQQSALEYETVLEFVSEKFRAHPNYIRKINPGMNWDRIQAGTSIKVPDTSMPMMRFNASFIRISLSRRLMQVFDSTTNLLAHFPCSIAQKVEKRPAGELRVIAIAPDPNYTFNPAVFPESEEARNLGRKLILPPGPNNPVGVAWISLDKPGYGIHGTPQPEQVGRTESHGCFRLANWNAAHLLQLVYIGMPVYVEGN